MRRYERLSGDVYGGLAYAWGLGNGNKGQGKGKEKGQGQGKGKGQGKGRGAPWWSREDDDDYRRPIWQPRQRTAARPAISLPSPEMVAPAPRPTSAAPVALPPVLNMPVLPQLPGRYTMSKDITDGVDPAVSLPQTTADPSQPTIQQAVVVDQPAGPQVLQPALMPHMMMAMPMPMPAPMSMPQQTQPAPRQIAPVTITPQQARLGALASAAAAALLFL